MNTGWNADVFMSLWTFHSNLERTLAPIRQQQEAIDAVVKPYRQQQTIIAAALDLSEPAKIHGTRREASAAKSDSETS